MARINRFCYVIFRFMHINLSCCTLTSSVLTPTRRSTSRCLCTSSDASSAKKSGVVHHAVTELEISCLPANLPAFIEVDLGNLEIGQTIHLGDLKLPEGVTAISHDESMPIVTATAATETAEAADEDAPAADAPAADAEAKDKE